MSYDQYYNGMFAMNRLLTDQEETELTDILEKEHKEPDAPSKYIYYWVDKTTNPMTSEMVSALETHNENGHSSNGMVRWLRKLIPEWFAPRGILLDGEIYWEGDENDDSGYICIEKNEVYCKLPHTTYHRCSPSEEPDQETRRCNTKTSGSTLSSQAANHS
jgi:hypothetical protein